MQTAKHTLQPRKMLIFLLVCHITTQPNLIVPVRNYLLVRNCLECVSDFPLVNLNYLSIRMSLSGLPVVTTHTFDHLEHLKNV